MTGTNWSIFQPRLWSALGAFLALSACSTVNLPPINTGSAETALPGKIIWHELLTDTPTKTQTFYATLFGWEFAPLADEDINYRLITHNGKPIGGMVDQTRLPTTADISQWVQLLAVADIEAATSVVRDNGGTVFTPPTSLGDRGTVAVVADPQGGLFALLETDGKDPADTGNLPESGQFLWNELWTSDLDGAARFYAQLAPYEVNERMLTNAEGQVSYRVLSSQQQRRAGIRANPVEDLKTLWVNYLRVSNEAALNDILAQVEGLGGEILVPAVARPGGGHVAIIAGPSGAGIALQAWSEQDSLSTLEAQ